MAAQLAARADRRDEMLFLLAVAGFLFYAALFIARTSFVVEGERYFSLFDDAMVSMRYGKNLAQGFGLVWNPGGERVEGYTNLLWVLYMSLIHLLPIAPSKTSLFVQMTAAAFLALNLYYVRAIALAVSGGSRLIAWGAVALTATYLPINNWSLQGMEVSVLVLLTTICTWLAIRGMETGAFQRWLYPVLGVATLVRPDMVVLFLAFHSFMLLTDPVHRRKHALWGLVILTGAVAAQTTFRIWYYEELLPNTYYLKMTGVPLTVRLSRGLYVLLQFVWKANPLLFVLTLTLAFRKDKRIWLLFWTLAAQMAYSIYVGGDAWEYWGGSNRYFCIAMPGFFVLLSYALHLVTSALIEVVQADHPITLRGLRRASVWTFAASLVYAVVSLNSIHGMDALAEAALVRPVLHAGPGNGNQRDVRQALLLRRATMPDATVAVMRAGTIPYFADRSSVDLLGKNDRVVAHLPASASEGPIRFTDFRPGHMKFDFAHSIGRLQPDVILQLRRRTELAKPFLQGDYKDVLLEGGCMFVRRDSPRVRWDRLPPHGCDEEAGLDDIGID
jgi:hypothetical protein